MYRDDFVAADGQSWWLCETEIDYRIGEARTELGATLGWSDREWYADPNQRSALYDLLETRGSHLVNELDHLSDDDARLQWVHDATHLAAPPQAAAGLPLAPAPASTPVAPEPLPKVAPTPAAPQIEDSVQSVLAHVTGDGLVGLADDLGVEPSELEAIVNHPEFEREVREELARITTN